VTATVAYRGLADPLAHRAVLRRGLPLVGDAPRAAGVTRGLDAPFGAVAMESRARHTTRDASHRLRPPKRMSTAQLRHLGVPFGEPMDRARDLIDDYIRKGGDRDRIPGVVAAVVADPAAHVDDPLRGALGAGGGRGRRPARDGGGWRRRRRER
jgi:hypothetical protein